MRLIVALCASAGDHTVPGLRFGAIRRGRFRATSERAGASTTRHSMGMPGVGIAASRGTRRRRTGAADSGERWRSAPLLRCSANSPLRAKRTNRMRCIPIVPERPYLVVIWGPDSSLICAFSNDIVGPGQYDIDPSTLTLVSE